jgi:hypothetical protein
MMRTPESVPAEGEQLKLTASFRELSAVVCGLAPGDAVAQANPLSPRTNPYRQLFSAHDVRFEVLA